MSLFTPYKLGNFQLTNRMVYAPLTRCRSPGYIPGDNVALYYSQRAAPGQLMLTEATTISQQGDGYPNVPGIYRDEQVEGWRKATKAVHDKGGIFFCQLWHVGRQSHNAFQPGEQLPVSSSATPFTEPLTVYTSQGPKEAPTPRALDKSELPGIVEDYRKAAANAIKAGFDGVEIHSANGYLLEQFIKDGVNKRTDEYGGSIENRCRLTLEVAKAVVDEVGAGRVGIRLTPYGTFGDMTETDPVATYTYLVKELNKLKLLYVHMVEARMLGNEVDPNHDAETGPTLKPFRDAFGGPFLVCGNYNKELANEAIDSHSADLVVFGRVYLANPDLPRRFLEGAPLNYYLRDLFYAPEPVKGYTDYPYLEETEWWKQGKQGPTWSRGGYEFIGNKP